MISLQKIKSLVDDFLNILKISDRSVLMVLAGFPVDKITINCEYLFSHRIKSFSEYLDKARRRIMINEAVTRGNEGGIFWCTLEDYLLLNAAVFEEFFDLKFVKIPYYNNILPIYLEFDESLQTHFSDEDDCATESMTPVFLNDEISNAVDRQISQIYIIEDVFYYTTPVKIAWEPIPLKSPSLNRSSSTAGHEFTITEDEGSWVSLCEWMMRIPDGDHVEIFISSETLKASYRNAVLYLDMFSENTVTLKSEETPAARVQSYDTLSVLKKYWKVPGFRDFLVYRNVRSDRNVRIETVSQENVIDDILTQVDYAISDKAYRDIFVTAPTGSGKSVMFQIPSILLHEKGLLTLVISPLIALMNDQVYSLTDKGLNIAATINSSVSLSEKDFIIQKVQDGDISVLYLSPESLLSRSDIKSLIGNRTVGLLVIDEAHIVTTWGKAFRPDYWYLGNYIQRLRKEHQFPIATFTATTVYMGPEDMYSETRDSLGMRDPITYFGYIPRDNIEISFEHSGEFVNTRTQEYNEVKFSVLASRLEEFKRANKKVLVYFPFVSLIGNFLEYVVGHLTDLVLEDMVQYHGGLAHLEKKENFIKYKTNVSRIMLATKAFGMGIDIPDIDVVYHYAPTGNVCDYVQEIGRAARDHGIRGLAKFDYLEKDFSFVNRLHGISTIKKFQLLNLIKKIVEIGKQHGYRRNLLISSDDFHLVFEEGGRFSERDADNLDNKVKTALLIIEKDFLLKLGYSPIIARPRALFTFAYFRGKRPQGNSEIEKIFGTFQVKMESVYKVDLKSFWEKQYPNYSFAKFKFELYSNPQKFGFSMNDSIVPIVLIDIKSGETDSSVSQDRFIDAVLEFCDTWKQSGKYFKQKHVEEFILKKFNETERIKISIFAETILNFLDVWNRSISLNYGRFLTYREDLGYRIIGSGYIDVRDFYQSIAFDKSGVIYVESTPERKKNLARVFALLGLFETANLLSYTIQGGENPEIFVRINSYFHLQNTIRRYDLYENIILQNVWHRHENSVRFLHYLFSNINNNTQRFWEFIESYFLGRQPDFEQGIDQQLIQVER